MAGRTLGEIFFGTEEDRKRAKSVLKEMRPDYQRPGEKAPVKKANPSATKDWEKAYQTLGTKTGVDAPVRAVRRAIPIPQPKPDMPKKVEQKKAEPKKVQQKPMTKAKSPTAPKKPVFKGNWVGAAPTAMQARGGARIKRSSFADLLKRKG